MNDAFVRQRQAHGAWATIMWLVSGVFLFATHGAASFLSWQALVYFLPGVFGAALVFGMLGFSLQIAIMRALSRLGTGNAPNRALVAGLGYGLMAFEALAIYLAAQWVVTELMFS